MARQRFFFGVDGPPFSYFVERLLKDDSFRNGLKRVESLPEDRLAALASALTAHKSFLDRIAVEEIMSIHTPGVESSPLAKFILRLNGTIRDSSESPEESLIALREAMKEHPEEFSATAADTIVSRLHALILSPRGFARQKKAESLAEATGNELNDIAIICDVRPVFDEDRKEIDGALQITTIRLEVSDPDGRIVAVECRLTERQLDDLCKAADAAKRKSAKIKERLLASSVPLARTSDSPTEKEK